MKLWRRKKKREVGSNDCKEDGVVVVGGGHVGG